MLEEVIVNEISHMPRVRGAGRGSKKDEWKEADKDRLRTAKSWRARPER